MRPSPLLFSLLLTLSACTGKGTDSGPAGSADGADGGTTDGTDGTADGADGTADGADGTADGTDGTGGGTLADLGPMAIWLDASALTGLADGDPVPTIPDQSGAGNDVGQTESTAQPTYQAAGVGGQPSVSFDGDGMATAADFGLIGDAAFTAITVAVFPSVAGGYPLAWLWGDCGVSAGCASLEGKGDTLVLATGWFMDAEPAAGSFDAHWAQPTVLTISKPAGPLSGTRIFFDGVEQTVGGVETVPAFTAAPFQVGSWNLSQPMTFDLGELIVYEGALADEDRSAAECSLAAKYGIAVTPTVACE
jgi:hypothetical protein